MPTRDREPLAQRAGRRFDAGQHGAVGMALQRAAELAQGDELLLGEVAGPGHGRVERGNRVALGEHQPIAVGPRRAMRIVAHAGEEERGDHVDHRERAARMTGAGVGQHPDDLDAAVAGDRLQAGDVGHQAAPP